MYVGRLVSLSLFSLFQLFISFFNVFYFYYCYLLLLLFIVFYLYVYFLYFSTLGLRSNALILLLLSILKKQTNIFIITAHSL